MTVQPQSTVVDEASDLSGNQSTPQAGSGLPTPIGASAGTAGSLHPAELSEATTHPAVLIAIIVVIGIGAGLGGMLLAMLLHLIQHLAYGYSLAAVISRESFLNGVSEAPSWRRLAAMTVCGLVAGLGWWAVYAHGRPLVSIKQAVKSDDASMPLATLGHALLQIVTVGLGSPLGREVAPREVGALFATWIARRAGLSRAETKVMVACGAGAGLAAVYNVPLGGGVFTLEVLLQTFSLTAAVPAIATSVIAALVAWVGLGDEAQYRLPDLQISASLVCWSVLAGPVFGYAGHWYTQLAAVARSRAPRNWRLLPWNVAVFVVIGAAAVLYPHLLGNGKGPLQLGLDSDLGLGLAAVLLVLKLVATTACLRAGAEGGMLTPGLAIGGLFATVIGIAWSTVWPGAPLGSFALVGATAFLASSMTMPLTAVVLVMEFTRVDHDFLIPILLAVGGSMASRQWGRR